MLEHYNRFRSFGTRQIEAVITNEPVISWMPTRLFALQPIVIDKKSGLYFPFVKAQPM